MAVEIERGFLIKNDQWKTFVTQKISIEQGYLSDDMDNWIIRIRFNGKNFKIALKKHIKDFTSFEFEYLIPFNDGEKIMSNLTKTIKKERFFLEVDNRNWIIDCFKENNFPLEIAEIELSDENQEVRLPTFLSKEITGLKIFTNFSLTTYPFSQWDENELKYFKKN